MRYIIIGNHASGKHKILDALEELGVEVGREFTTSPTKIFDLDPKAHQITQLEVEELFKNQDYITICNIVTPSNEFYRGITKTEYDTKKVFVMTPEMLNNVYASRLKGDVCFIWIDDPKPTRYLRFINERRTYPFEEVESKEKFHVNNLQKLITKLAGDEWLYFSNDEEKRILAVIYSLVKYPDLIDIYTKNFK